MRTDYHDYYGSLNQIYYSTINYNESFNVGDFNFTIDDIKIIDNNIQAVEIKYSFNCITQPVNNSDEVNITNGKGKCTIEYNQ